MRIAARCCLTVDLGRGALPYGTVAGFRNLQRFEMRPVALFDHFVGESGRAHLPLIVSRVLPRCLFFV